eukprot:TRINITY_DN7424_c0_g1_i7.p3 TRINITY_DN7424_c0_g1~~TRINITY_DN7424_c0_g1_i7.p3  ORF type:complete len:122 (-),score=0.91 TRINITY_DN7424_c0_g1_i7:166-531(-)
MINSILEFVGSEKEKLKGVQLVYFFQIGLFSSFFFFVIFTFSFQCAFFVDSLLCVFRGILTSLISCFVWKIVRVKGANISRQIFLLVIQIEIGNYFRVFMSVSNSLVRFIMNVFQCANIVN